jgi:hypothetical protein
VVQSTQTALNILSILEKSPGQGRRFKGGGAAFVREICLDRGIFKCHSRSSLRLERRTRLVKILSRI